MPTFRTVDPIAHRHDLLLLFDVVNGNPNGDPDADNQPRQDPMTDKGLISDVCLKRKVRQFILEFGPKDIGEGDNAYNILIQQGAVIEREQKRAIKAVQTTGVKDKDQQAYDAMQWLFREFYDVRTFGGVLSTGDDILKGSAWGQVRGPVQVTLAKSFHPVVPLGITVTRGAVTREADAAKERTMGHKYIIPYALYAARVYVSAPLAERTGFSQRDFEVLTEALLWCFEHDRAAGRPEIVVRGLYDFEHVGREDDPRSPRLGCAHAHTLVEGIAVEICGGKEIPESFEDYGIRCRWDYQPLPEGVVLHKLHERD